MKDLSTFAPASAELADDLRRAQAGDAWHGSAVGELVHGVTAVEAGAHPVRGAHSMWEIVLHVGSWRQEVARRLASGTLAEPAAGDWPAVPAVNEAAWRAAYHGGQIGILRKALAAREVS